MQKYFPFANSIFVLLCFSGKKNPFLKFDGGRHGVLSPSHKKAEVPKMGTPADERPRRKGRPGRIASLFRLNKEKYDQMKEDGDKQEF